jgi:hypothetical protein
MAENEKKRTVNNFENQFGDKGTKPDMTDFDSQPLPIRHIRKSADKQDDEND